MKNLKLQVVFAISVFIFSIFSVSSAGLGYKTVDSIRLVVNGAYRKTEKPVLRYKTTYAVPVREMAGFVGVDLSSNQFVWNGDTSSLELFYNGRNIMIFNQNKIASLDSQKFQLQFKPFIQHGALYMSYVDFANIIGLLHFWEEGLKTISLCKPEIYSANKQKLSRISEQLESSPGIAVDIKFDYEDERLFFNFKVNRENRLLNGTLLIDKFFENRHITERSEVFVKNDNLFIKDYRINKWRFDESGSFDVANSFLKIFSSRYMLHFTDLACATFNKYEGGNFYTLQNKVIFNEYMMKDLGFSGDLPFNFRMTIDKKTDYIRNLSVVSTGYAGSELKTSRLDVNFTAFGHGISIDLPKEDEFLVANPDDVRKLNAVKKALILFMFDAGEEAYSYIQNAGSVEKLIRLLQTQFEIRDSKSGEKSLFGPYLSTGEAYGEQMASYYRPVQDGKKGISIRIDRGSRSISVEAANEDSLTVK